MRWDQNKCPGELYAAFVIIIVAIVVFGLTSCANLYCFTPDINGKGGLMYCSDRQADVEAYGRIQNE